MRRYKVIRIYQVSAESKREALDKLRANADPYLEAEYAKEIEETGWGATLRKQVLGPKR